MQTSAEVAELFAALAMAQGRYTDVVKDKKAKIESQKGSYGYPYADIAGYIEAIRPALTEAKLAVIQAPAVEHGSATVTTRIVHASGQWVETELSMPIGQQTPQAVGSAITYARRYSLVAMLCLAAEDDDGEQAERKSERSQADDIGTTRPVMEASPKCPKCGGPMGDNREGKTNPKAPDFKCKNRACGFGVWVDSLPAAAMQPEPAIAPAQAKPPALPADQAPMTPWQKAALHSAGSSYYGKEWDTKRHELVSKVTRGRTQSSADLTASEANTLIDGINRRANEEAAAAAQAEASEPF